MTRARTIIHATSRGFAALAAVALIFLMMLTVVDVTRRALTDRAIAGGIELAPLVLLGAVVLGLGYAELTRTHVRTSLVTSRLPPRVRAGVRATTYALGVALLLWIAFLSADRALNAFRFGDSTPGFVGLPTWPARGLVPFGLTLFALELGLSMIDDVRRVRGKDPSEVGGADEWAETDAFPGETPA